MLAIILAAAACFGVGAIYYTVLAKPWMAAIGKTEEDLKMDRPATPFVIAAIAQIIAVGMMRHMFVQSNITTIGAGALAGAGIGAFIAGAWIFINNGYEGKKMSLSFINTGYAALGLAAAGAVLGYFL